MRSWILPFALALATATSASGQEPVRYLLRVDDPSSRTYHLEAELPATGEETLISLPAWTPGHYTIENYASKVSGFHATGSDGSTLDWDKLDKDTWRIASTGTDRVRVAYDFLADTINLSGSRLQDGFGFFNGTNLFVYPETGYEFDSTLRIELPEGWRIATELEEGDEPGLFRASDYHELVDQPTFVGNFGMDSVRVDGAWIRLAVHPAERLDTPFGRSALEALRQIADYLHDFFDEEPPYDRYTALIYLPSEPIGFAGGLEHADSHFDILPAQAVDNPALLPLLQSLLSHEYFHAWNVKRLRPVEMWPYAYDREQFTPLLWVSEGITDYYADLVLARVGTWSREQFWESLTEAVGNVEAIEPASVEDASLDTWIDPIYVPGNYYYDKGKLIGLLLDTMIRDATDGGSGLDDVILRLYRDRYLEGEGFSTEDVLEAVGELAGEEGVRQFYRRHIDGREPLPYAGILDRIGIEYVAETVVEPFVGVALRASPEGRPMVFRVTPGSAAEAAGLEEGDILLRVGEVTVDSPAWVDRFHERYGDRVGQPLTIVYRRDGRELSGETTVRTREREEYRLDPNAEAPERARRLREGLLRPALSERSPR